ncbi:MAG: sel1 repeat family protein [Gammaproteobacteria bacterium]|nr:sel1 repeat family protein [Gammaproteobacteria bacterium]
MRYFTTLLLLMFSQTLLANKCVDLIKKEDFYEASDVCAAMAQKGDMNAQFSLGVLYYQGNGIIADMTEAQKWIRKAAEQNHNQAQYNLGILLANGHGSSANLVEAYAWLKISADNGYSAASDSVSQLGQELSAGEKKEANERIKILKEKFKLK